LDLRITTQKVYLNKGDDMKDVVGSLRVVADRAACGESIDTEELLLLIKEAYSEIEYLRCRVARLEGLA
jgi:hypothetical protein